MKYEAAFRKYLNGSVSRRTGKPMGVRAAQDVISRCDRVERMLGLDLHAELSGSENRMEAVAEKIRDDAPELGFVGNKRYYYNDFISAVRRYRSFLTGDRARQWSLAPKRTRAR